ncbi:hypothetical protein P8C59_006388 [Phyllachora maydis]|uniref:Uncharacterized protein n=1 Tax=Phyllachora maydis TaxID=1825666 RepID=A0AAD9I7F0_9PEZI|nr:hypothetical protein P8C59_006388 [Phyllachora maydis]
MTTAPPPAPSPAPISSLLTVIITTSPTPSAPSTELLTAVFASFAAHAPALLACPVIVVLDAYDRVAPRNRLKKGTVTPALAAAYAAYRRNVKALVCAAYRAPGAPLTATADAEFGLAPTPPATHRVGLALSATADARVVFVEPVARLGFGLAVRSALRLADTPFVWVHQHDWALVADVPVAGLLDVMGRHPTPGPEEEGEGGDEAVVPVKYVCLASARMRAYAASAHATEAPALRLATARLRRDFVPAAGGRIPLTPFFAWHDKPHVASRAHYLARVFPSRLALGRGDFIEDTVGQRAREQMKAGCWGRWACWLYYPDEGRTLCLRHLHGRTFRGAEEEARRKGDWAVAGRAAAAAAAAANALGGSGLRQQQQRP